jgi:membrane fusion protein, heavy metal efflux system
MSYFHLSLVAAFIGIIFTSNALAHSGHGHAGESAPISVQTAPRATAESQFFELVAVSDGTKLTIYVDRFESNEPVIGAQVDIETPTGPVTAEPDGNAYSIDAPWASKPGDYELLFTVTAQTDIDFLTGRLTVPEASAPPVQNVSSGSGVGAFIAQNLREIALWAIPSRARSADPAIISTGIFGLLIGAFAMAFRHRKLLIIGFVAFLIVVAMGTSFVLAETPANLATAGKPVIRDVAQRLPDGSVFAPKTTQRILAILTVSAVEAESRKSIEMPGRVIPDPNASGFVQTAIGGRLLAPPGGFPSLGAKVTKGQLMAYVEPSLAAVDQSDIRQTKGELDQDIALAERQIERIRTLAKSGTASRTQLEEADLTLDGLRKRRASLDSNRMEPEQLVAPVSGVVSKANAAPGLIAETNTEVFHIIDPTRLWVEAMSFGRDQVTEKAFIGTLDQGAVQLTFVGAGFAEEGRAQPMHFRVNDTIGRLLPGDRVTVVAETQAVIKGIAAPREAVIRGSNGEDIVYIHKAPELFEPRAVRTEPLDGGRVIIVSGIVAGDRIVTQGAELLNQLR